MPPQLSIEAKTKFRVPFGTVSITDEARKLISQALDTKMVTRGKYVAEFEEKFAAIFGVKYGVAMSSGTDADALACAVLYDYGAKRGDEIIVPALTFVATGNAVLQAGLTPVFVDVERETLNIDCDKIEKVITKKTRAIMPVHLMGKPAEMDKIRAIAKKHKLYIIEDAAEAHGAQYRGEKWVVWATWLASAFTPRTLSRRLKAASRLPIMKRWPRRCGLCAITALKANLRSSALGFPRR